MGLSLIMFSKHVGMHGVYWVGGGGYLEALQIFVSSFQAKLAVESDYERCFLDVFFCYAPLKILVLF